MSYQLKRVLRAVLAAMPGPVQRLIIKLYRYHIVLLYDALRRSRGTDAYQRWVRDYDTLSQIDRAAILADISQFPDRPLISVLMPVFNAPEAHLCAALDSMLGQLYPTWELCIADDASTAPHIGPVLAAYALRDSRINVVSHQANGGISAASNSALAMAAGRFFALLDHDDVLPAHALYLIAREILRHPDTDLIYSDEDKLDRKDRRFDPYFKSDWNPDLFLSQNMISHLGVYRTALVRQVGGFRSEFDGSQDYDLALRVVENTDPACIRHIPHILYHWRASAGSAASAPDAKTYTYSAARSALNDHLARSRIRAEATSIPRLSFFQVRYALETEPLVSIVVPTRDRHDLLSRCVRGLLNGTSYRNLEVLIVDNGSSDPAVLRYLGEIGRDPRVRVLRYEHPFNFSAINNWASTEAGGDILSFLNNDTEVIEPDWLTHMVANATRPKVGAVGAKLLYPNGRVQHGGIILGIGGVGGHFHLRRRDDDPGYFGRAHLQQNLSAVTAACLAMRREHFEEIGGFDAENLPIAFNDVDLCLRLRERGYLIVWTPLARLYHHETASRASDLVGERQRQFARERDYMRARWGAILDNDPYFNPNLSLEDVTIALAFPPRRPYPWCSTTASAGDAERPS